MAVEKFTPPKFQQNNYHCPFCGVYAHQEFFGVGVGIKRAGGVGYQEMGEARISRCGRCGKFSYWVKGVMVHPEASVAPMPNEDLVEAIQKDFQEARAIVQKSPRGAAALLRLCIQKLCVQLGLPGKDLDTDIGKLVERGLSTKIQKALDIVRVVGNNAVHPGQMVIDDDIDTALKLFELVNLIAQTMITEEKSIDKLFGSLPQGARDAISKRDAGVKK